MDRREAVTRLAKRFGKQFAYQIDKNAPSPEEREEAKALNAELVARSKAADAAMEARYKFLLANDAEYQALRAAAREARKAKDGNYGKVHHYKISVGTSNSLFFHVAASGDSWEQIFEKLEKKKVAA